MPEHDFNDEFYWSQGEVLRRFELVKRDVASMIDTRIRLAAGDLKLERESEDYVRGYCDGLEEYTLELEYILNKRFGEIMNELEKRG